MLWLITCGEEWLQSVAQKPLSWIGGRNLEILTLLVFWMNMLMNGVKVEEPKWGYGWLDT